MVKYLGSVLVEAPSNDEATAEAIDTIMTMVREDYKMLHNPCCMGLDFEALHV